MIFLYFFFILIFYLFVFRIIKKIKFIFVNFCLSLNMHILCPRFGYYVIMKKSSQHFMCWMWILHNYSLLFLLLNISHHNVKNEKWSFCIQMDQSYCGGTWMKNGPRFCNTLMIKLRPHWNWNAKKPSRCNSHIIFTTNYISFM